MKTLQRDLVFLRDALDFRVVYDKKKHFYRLEEVSNYTLHPSFFLWTKRRSSR